MMSRGGEFLPCSYNKFCKPSFFHYLGPRIVPHMIPPYIFPGGGLLRWSWSSYCKTSPWPDLGCLSLSLIWNVWVQVSNLWQGPCNIVLPIMCIYIKTICCWYNHLFTRAYGCLGIPIAVGLLGGEILTHIPPWTMVPLGSLPHGWVYYWLSLMSSLLSTVCDNDKNWSWIKNQRIRGASLYTSFLFSSTPLRHSAHQQ